MLCLLGIMVQQYHIYSRIRSAQWCAQLQRVSPNFYFSNAYYGVQTPCITKFIPCVCVRACHKTKEFHNKQREMRLRVWDKYFINLISKFSQTNSASEVDVDVGDSRFTCCCYCGMLVTDDTMRNIASYRQLPRPPHTEKADDKDDDVQKEEE